jgi:hemerythrin-like domain-containing protein
MRPTDILKEEHRVILGALDCLDRMTERFEREGNVDPTEVTEVCDFFFRFADRVHHGKEEDRLFPAMHEGGFPRDGGPIPVMVLEHEQGRALVRAMRKGGEEGTTSDFVRSARQLSQLLRLHIDKEDHCLFSMAEGALTPERGRKLLEEFAAWDATADCAEDRRFGLEVAETLAARYGRVVGSEVPAADGCCD